MKLLFLAIAATSFFQIQKCEALNIPDIIGNCRVKLTAVVDGKKTPATATSTITRETFEYDGERYEATVLREYYKFKGNPIIYSEQIFFDDGDYYSVEQVGNSEGELIAYSSGSFTVSENKIYVNSDVYDGETDALWFSKNMTYTTKGRKKIVFSRTDSDGDRFSGVMVRKGK
jgi:hypothetical protein